MDIFLKISLCGILILTLQACSSGYCRMNEKSQQAQQNKLSGPEVDTQKKTTVKVFKYDGSQQCSMGKQVSLEEMSKEFGTIKILSQAHLNDGLMRIQLCGSPTGYANVYEIDMKDLEKAVALGFREWTFD